MIKVEFGTPHQSVKNHSDYHTIITVLDRYLQKLRGITISRELNGEPGRSARINRAIPSKTPPRTP